MNYDKNGNLILAAESGDGWSRQIAETKSGKHIRLKWSNIYGEAETIYIEPSGEFNRNTDWLKAVNDYGVTVIERLMHLITEGAYPVKRKLVR